MVCHQNRLPAPSPTHSLICKSNRPLAPSISVSDQVTTRPPRLATVLRDVQHLTLFLEDGLTYN